MVNEIPTSEVEMVKWDPWEISHSWEVQPGTEFIWDDQKAEALTLHVNKLFDTTVKYVLCHYTWSERDDTLYWRSFKNKKDISTKWAKDFFNNWGSSSIFGSWSFGLLAAGNNCWKELSDGGIDSFLWNDLNLQRMIQSAQVSFQSLSAKDLATLEALALGKYTRRQILYKKHVAHALPLINQDKFLEYFINSTDTKKLIPATFLYNEHLN